MWQICYSFVKSPLFIAPRILYYAITYEEGFKGVRGFGLNGFELPFRYNGLYDITHSIRE